MHHTKPRGVKEWTREDMILVSKLLKEFTVQEVAEKTGMSVNRITGKATKQGWPVRSDHD